MNFLYVLGPTFDSSRSNKCQEFEKINVKIWVESIKGRFSEHTILRKSYILNILVVFEFYVWRLQVKSILLIRCSVYKKIGDRKILQIDEGKPISAKDVEFQAKTEKNGQKPLFSPKWPLSKNLFWWLGALSSICELHYLRLNEFSRWRKCRDIKGLANRRGETNFSQM